MRNLSDRVINAADDSVSQISVTIDASQLFAVSAQAVFSNVDAAGTFKLQASNDLSTANNLPGIQSPLHWNDIPNTSQTVTVGGNILIPKTDICYRWIRTVWTPSAGTGTITVTVDALGY